MASVVICLSTGKGFYRVDTPLFEGLIVVQQVDDVADEGAASVAVDDVPIAIDEPYIPSPTPTTQPPPPSQDLPSAPQDKIAQTLEIIKLKQRVKKLERRNKLKVSKQRRLKRVGTSQRVDISKDIVMDDVSKQGRIIASIDADEDVTMKDVADIAKEVSIDAKIEENADVQRRQAKYQAQIYQIDLEHANKVLSMQDDEVELAELQKVVEVVTTAKLMTKVVTAASATIIAATTSITDATITAAPKPKFKDKGKGIMVEEPKPLKNQAQIEQDEAFARELKAELNKTINWDDVIDQVQRKEKEDNVVMRYQALKRKPQTEAQARKNMMIYLSNMARFKMDYFKGMSYDDIRLIFKKKFNSNAIPLAFKVPVVYYAIHTENNKPYFKIIRDDLAGREKISITRFTLDQMLNNVRLEVKEETLELMLLRTSRKICQVIKTAGEDLLLPIQIMLLDDAAELRLLKQSAVVG
nr:hypothetical protein [Tanacetum cinerariifolium]